MLARKVRFFSRICYTHKANEQVYSCRNDYKIERCSRQTSATITKGDNLCTLLTCTLSFSHRLNCGIRNCQVTCECLSSFTRKLAHIIKVNGKACLCILGGRLHLHERLPMAMRQGGKQYCYHITRKRHACQMMCDLYAGLVSSLIRFSRDTCQERREDLQRAWGFRCECQRCQEEVEELSRTDRSAVYEQASVLESNLNGVWQTYQMWVAGYVSRINGTVFHPSSFGLSSWFRSVFCF